MIGGDSMSILRNNTKRLIVVNGEKLIPGRATADINVDALKSQYPMISDMLALSLIHI